MELFLFYWFATVAYLAFIIFKLSKDRKKAEQLLLREKAESHAILTSIGDGLLATDNNGNIVLVNKVFEELLGYKNKDVLGKHVFDVITLVDEEGAKIDSENRPQKLALRTTEKITAIHYVTRKDNTVFPVRITAAPILIDNELRGIVEVFHDVTHEKELETAKDEFISIASHELRTPMTAIKGLSSMIIGGDYGAINEGLKKPLTTIHDSADRQITLINDLLDVSRLQTGKLTYSVSPFEIKQVLEETVEHLESIAKKKHLELSLKKCNAVEVQGDVMRVKQVLNNLIGNALKFTEEGSVTLSLHTDKDFAFITVKDTGVGIDVSDTEKLFGKFRQLRTNMKTKPQGSGLGLYLARVFAQKMGGNLILKTSKKGHGSTFVFSLPKTGTIYAKEAAEALAEETEIANEKKKAYT